MRASRTILIAAAAALLAGCGGGPGAQESALEQELAAANARADKAEAELARVQKLLAQPSESGFDDDEPPEIDPFGELSDDAPSEISDAQ